jgi:predicted outer membrane repeat protein
MKYSGHKPCKYVFLVALVSGLTAARAASAAITVCSSGCSYSSIQAAVNAAPAGETIRIMDGVFTGGVTITDKNLVIRGSGVSHTVVDRGPVSVSPAPPAIELKCTRAFQITITDLTITGGVPFHGFGGGGLENNGCTVNLNNAMVMNNGSRGGGGISNNSGIMMVRNSTIINNGSKLGGGGISNQGNLTLVSSVISDNSTTSPGKGGGIENGGTLVVRDSTIANNQGPDGGGVANAVGGTARFAESVITNNSTTSPQGEGGGLWNVGSLILRGTLVIANKSGNIGGGIFTKAGGSLVLNGSTLTRNSAGTSGGGVYTDGVTSVVNSLISNNTPNNCSGTGLACP